MCHHRGKFDALLASRADPGLGLVIGGALAAPLAGYLVRILPTRVVLTLAGIVVVALCLANLASLFMHSAGDGVSGSALTRLVRSPTARPNCFQLEQLLLEVFQHVLRRRHIEGTRLLDE